MHGTSTGFLNVDENQLMAIGDKHSCCPNLSLEELSYAPSVLCTGKFFQPPCCGRLSSLAGERGFRTVPDPLGGGDRHAGLPAAGAEGNMVYPRRILRRRPARMGCGEDRMVPGSAHGRGGDSRCRTSSSARW